jgi:hypothetical protein
MIPVLPIPMGSRISASNLMERVIAILALFVALAGLVTGGRWVVDQLQIDSCLDHGGRWDYKRSACQGDRPER